MSNPWMPTGETLRLDRSVWQPPQQSRSTTRLLGDGPPEANPSHAIERQPFVWDGNGFYRRLGLKPGASRREVAEAYMRLGGQRSSRLTTAARTLIDKRTKPYYDAMMLGSLWPDDEDLVQAVIDGELIPEKPTWAVYIYDLPFDELLPSIVARVDTWRWMIALLMWRSGGRSNFAMGVAEIGAAAIVGYRKVMFVPLDMEPNWQYATDLVIALNNLGDGT